MIDIKNVFKVYKMGTEKLKVLDDVSVNIKKGEFVAIVGPSGSGKSTLMNIIGGLDTPTKGEVFIDGENISKYNDKQMSRFRNNKIGFVFQSFNLEPTLTALENVMLPLMFSGTSEKERKERAINSLSLVELSDRGKHKPTELSGGQRQRVSIARALVTNPKIILADEPTGNLDSKSGKNIMDILQGFKSQGYTIVMVTHNPEEASYADRVIEIQDGAIEEEV
ncbi:ABC transporter ATP-binding protein [Clostridium hydrogeniformans]|uniref:ABC transporter ATP-binding protein n=1 Tax=Clostridium hydrogeniformans TaxID=349933 RepID=UPI0004863207|nr:ABC transporter ATP-binding protein [Clostridium hydrogeniformans]